MYRVSAGHIRNDALTSRTTSAASAETRWASMPLFIRNAYGSRGILRRQCTREYKITPIERCIRYQLLHLRPKQRAPKRLLVRQWLGISADEPRRIRMSTNAWCANVYPLCNLPTDNPSAPVGLALNLLCKNPGSQTRCEYLAARFTFLLESTPNNPTAQW